ncbi:MAG: DUF3108 domain-containing protein [Rickettsiales bacterium]
MRKITLFFRRCSLLVLALAAFSAPGWAQNALRPISPLEPFTMTGLYRVTWNGINVGRLVLKTKETDDDYALEAYVKSSGIAHLLTRHESTSSVKGNIKGNQHLPKRFETIFKLRGKTRHIILDYDDDGNLVKEFNDPPENRQKRPEVPEELKKHVIDVLTLLFAQRGKIYRALLTDTPTFTLRAYDGRRLTDLQFTIHGRKTLFINDTNQHVVHYSVHREPVAGYKDSELEKIQQEKEPDINMYLSDDGKLVPLRIAISSEAGDFYANFTKDCESLEACLKRL